MFSWEKTKKMASKVYQTPITGKKVFAFVTVATTLHYGYTVAKSYVYPEPDQIDIVLENKKHLEGVALENKKLLEGVALENKKLLEQVALENNKQ